MPTFTILHIHLTTRNFMFYKMSNLKESIRSMPKAIERNDQRMLNHIYRLVVELLIHIDDEKKEKDRAKRVNAQPIVE